MRRRSTFKPASHLLCWHCVRALAALGLWCLAHPAQAQDDITETQNELREGPPGTGELREPAPGAPGTGELHRDPTDVPHATLETRETPPSSSSPPATLSSPTPTTKHAPYAVEIEGHLVWQWNSSELAQDDGIGVGFRVSIPVIQYGPLPGFENSLAVSVGLAWASFLGCRARGVACSEDDFWVPAVAQWNFFITPDISLFPELGLGFRDAVAGRGAKCSGDCRRSALEIHPAFWLGGRFHLGYDLSLVARIGTPWLELGISYTM